MVAAVSRPKVLLVGRIEYAFEEWAEIEKLCEVVLTGKFDDELLEALPESVRYICNIGAGVDSIDLQACKRRGIQVSNTPSLAADGVAETVFFLIFGVLHRAAVPLHTARKGTLMMNKVIGLVGSGHIAQAVAFRARAFGMRVQYCTHSESSPSLENCTRTSFSEVIKASDIISLHVPLNDSTKNVLGKDQFDMMKPGAAIINTARGEVIDNAELCRAVQSGKVWGVGLDVYEQELHIPDEMREDDRFFILPHIATRTREIRGAMERVVIENLQAGIFAIRKDDGGDEGRLQNPV
ncbi:Putative D-isomer specific 2-hydroxyacid dehydrogenase, catalytic domain-containing protein [Septoria linicola]|uniref:D-isomer specific 2-hydroxyacid dehydrogenase, catalytic domain-containing protein n=1 Tax=Septoria linicola TaxID=215465 RepID=A0A9Q9B574_9PEZI|nr:Putative D-isomer specific 2-hydroxyacid dehydrogenase, catalytic domain-containing protein [Septoria linicola]